MDFCTICYPTPQPLVNTAEVTGQYGTGTACAGSINAVSQPLTTQYVSVEAIQTVYPTCARVGEKVKYTIVLRNRSSLPITQVKVTNASLAQQLQISNLQFNGMAVAGDLITGVIIPGIGAGSCGVLTFDALIPTGVGDTVEAAAQVTFNVQTNCGLEQFTITSNIAPLTVLNPALQVSITAVRCVVTAQNPVLTYRVAVVNTGTTTMNEVLANNQLPTGLQYVAGTTTVNGGTLFDRNPALGIPVGSLAPGESAWVEFNAQASF